jgi:D-amino-acid dehydrogenase
VTPPTRTAIVGAGAIGLACAYALRQRGEEVVVLDQGLPGEGCSKGNAGWIVPSLAEPLPAPGLAWTSLRWMLKGDSPLHIDPWAVPKMAGWLWTFWRHCNATDYRAGRAAWTRLTDHLMESFDSLVADGVSVEMHRDGLLFVFLSESEMRHVLDQLRSAGTAAEAITGAELHRLEPGLSNAVVAGVWVSGERHLRPESLCQGLLARIKAMGVEVRSGVTVTGGILDGDQVRRLRTTGEQIVADRFLIAAGARSGSVSAAVAGVPLPIQAGKGYSITVTAPDAPFTRPLYLDEAKLGCSPFVGGYRFAGTMELSGVNDRLVPARIAAIRRAARRYLALPTGGDVGIEWVGMRPLTPDGVPAIGRLPGRRNVYIATGHGMLGITAAVTTATVVADLMTRGQSVVDLSPFDPGRFIGR